MCVQKINVFRHLHTCFDIIVVAWRVSFLCKPFRLVSWFVSAIFTSMLLLNRLLKRHLPQHMRTCSVGGKMFMSSFLDINLSDTASESKRGRG